MYSAEAGPSSGERDGLWEEQEDAFLDDDYAEGSEEELSEGFTDEEDVPESRPRDKGKEREAPEAEPEVDQDFDRLVRDIRADDGSTGALSKVWDFDMKDRDTEFKDDLREASGVGKKRGRKPGRQKGVALSQQVKALIGEGNQAYVDNNIPETIRIMEEVIRIEPRAGMAWSVLAQCHEDGGDRQKALQLRIMAAHLNQDPEEWERLAEESRTQEYYQQALYCYRKLYQLDQTNVNALWDRASLAKEIGDLRTARHSFLAILKQIPHDLTVLAEIRPVLIELDDLELCEKLFDEAFAHYQNVFPNGQVTTDPNDGATFGLLEVLVLADLDNTLKRHERAVETIRRGCRWLTGRAAQKFWDASEDDREWDLPNGQNGESTRVVSEGEVQPGMYPLDINARHRLAIARIKLGDTAEGRMHANVILSQDIMEYAALFVEIADAYFERDMFTEARYVYDMLGADERTSSMYVLLQAAACRRMTGDLDDAAKVYEHAIKADPENSGAKMKLAEIYEILNEPRKALELVTQVIDSRRRARRQGQEGGEAGPSGTQPGASLFEEKARSGKDKGKKTRVGKLTAAELRELEAKKEQEAVQSYARVKAVWAQMLAGDEQADREWMHEAEMLVEQFQETRALYLTSRSSGFRGVFPRSGRKKQSAEANEESMASRLQLDIGRDSITRRSKGEKGGILDSFRTIKFDDWLRVFMQYCFNLTRRGRYPEAKDILEHILLSNAFQKRTYLDTIRCALITCSVGAGQYDVVVEQSRKLINTHQFNNEPFRILLASLASGYRATDSFLASTLSKHLLRELRAYDTALKNPDSLRWNPTLHRFSVAGAKAEDEDAAEGAEDTPEAQHRVKLPSKENPIGVALYGQICLAAKSYQSAIFYLLHAHDYCPHDPVICLCLAVASIGRAMQRQADNRQHLITQAMAFLSRYRALRGGDAPGEVEYNFGRAFHHLGLLSLAVKHYERVLEQAEAKLRSDPHTDVGLAREAAYNLSLIYVSTGATPLAQELYRRWLSL